MAERMVQKITLPYYGEVYVANAEEASLESMMQLQPALQKLYEYEQAEGVPVVRCSYCEPGSQNYNPCWLCKKGGTAHDVEHCHKTNYGDYEPMQPHCHLCGRKL